MPIIDIGDIQRAAISYTGFIVNAIKFVSLKLTIGKIRSHELHTLEFHSGATYVEVHFYLESHFRLDLVSILTLFHFVLFCILTQQTKPIMHLR